MRLPKFVWRVVRSRRTRVALVWGCFGGIVLLGLGYVGADWWGKRTARTYLKDVRARGGVMTLEAHFDRGVPDDENVLAHPVMLDELANEQLEGLRDSSFSFPSATVARLPPSPELGMARPTPVKEWFDPPLGLSEVEVARKLLDNIAADLERGDELAEALERPQIEWPGGGPGLTEEEAPECTDIALQMRRMGEFHLDSAVLYLAAGESGEAATQILRALRLADHCVANQPTAVAVLVAKVIRSQAGKVAQEGAIRSVWTAQDLGRLARGFPMKIEPSRLLKETIGTEVVFGREALQKMLRGGWDRSEIALFEGWDWAFEAAWERLMTLWSRLRPPGLALRENAASLEELEDLEGLFESQQVTFRTARDLEETLPGEEIHWLVGQLAIGICSMRTDSVLAEAGLALERYKLREGEYPAMLSELVPDFLDAVPEDPWTGDPLRYEHMANGGPRLWSFGADGDDDGGSPRHRLYSDEDGDEVWITRPIPGFTEKQFKAR